MSEEASLVQVREEVETTDLPILTEARCLQGGCMAKHLPEGENSTGKDVFVIVVGCTADSTEDAKESDVRLVPYKQWRTQGQATLGSCPGSCARYVDHLNFNAAEEVRTCSN